MFTDKGEFVGFCDQKSPPNRAEPRGSCNGIRAPPPPSLCADRGTLRRLAAGVLSERWVRADSVFLLYAHVHAMLLSAQIWDLTQNWLKWWVLEALITRKKREDTLPSCLQSLFSDPFRLWRERQGWLPGGLFLPRGQRRSSEWTSRPQKPSQNCSCTSLTRTGSCVHLWTREDRFMVIPISFPLESRWTLWTHHHWIWGTS